MKLGTDYIAASTNRFPTVTDIASDSTVFFGSSTLVSIWKADDDGGITETLAGHEGMITCIRSSSPTSFISADDRGVVHCWTKDSEETQWKSSKFQAHEKAICSMSVLDDCLVTGSSDSSVKIWKLSPGKAEEMQSISLSGRYPLSLSLAFLPESKNLVLAIGQTDRNVHIWTRSEDNFVRAIVLGGHDDWVKSLAFGPSSSANVLVLASGSQDATIRLWNIEKYQKGTRNGAAGSSLSDDLLDAFEESLGDFTDAEEGGRQVSLKRHFLSVKSATGSSVYSITFDALLIGHEAGITSISWQPKYDDSSAPTLLSTSTDSSLILWSPSSVVTNSGDASASIWINRQRFGDVGGQRLGGFVGGVWKKDGEEVMAWGWSGGWRRWRLVNGADDVWEEIGAIGGHSGHVKDLDWSPNGAYLISAGLDQTTRIHGPISSSDQLTTWHELSRPQVHGYDCLGVAFLEDLKFASISDEKVTRIFEAPQRFVSLVEALEVWHFERGAGDRPAAASVPPLGLSNKATEVASASTGDLPSRRPFEGELAAITLWPEVEKVFGHGYESSTIAASSSKKYIATACRATSPEHAVVRINETSTWQSVGQPLSGHSLTVTRIAFSPDDKLVLSVSRDRSWRLFKYESDRGYVPFLSEAKAHGRIIWDCAWSREGDIFATASRDKSVKIWGQKEPDKWSAIATIKCPEAATAVDFTAQDADGRRLLAIGIEMGDILVFSSRTNNAWNLESAHKVHVAHVTRLKWHPHHGSQLASCSEDGTLRVLTVQ